MLGELARARRPGVASARSSLGFGDAALVDTRVLLAHRLGADERRWPAAEDRFASDLLLHEHVADPWLRDADARRRRGTDPDRARRPHARRARASASALRLGGWTASAAFPLRTPTPSASDPELEALIRAEIAAGGPMTFARFMELALYHPDCGYYRGARRGRVGRGDFLTAPEAHPIFGRAIARLAADVWSALGRPVRVHRSGSTAPGREPSPRR